MTNNNNNGKDRNSTSSIDSLTQQKNGKEPAQVVQVRVEQNHIQRPLKTSNGQVGRRRRQPRNFTEMLMRKSGKLSGRLRNPEGWRKLFANEVWFF